MSERKKTLNDYFKKTGIKKYHFAEQTGISLRTISYLCAGRKVGPLIAKTIEGFTHGEVKAKDVCINPERL